METTPNLSLTEHFASLEDPRLDRAKLHSLLSIVTIVALGSHRDDEDE